MDAATGLPILPDGFFWRVKRWNSLNVSDHTLIVQLRRRVWFWSVKLEDSVCEHTPEDIRRSAGFAMNRARKRVEARANPPAVDRFVGDYPPKRLEDDL